jgi:hypothetical protein
VEQNQFLFIALGLVVVSFVAGTFYADMTGTTQEDNAPAVGGDQIDPENIRSIFNKLSGGDKFGSITYKVAMGLENCLNLIFINDNGNEFRVIACEKGLSPSELGDIESFTGSQGPEYPFDFEGKNFYYAPGYSGDFGTEDYNESFRGFLEFIGAVD